MHYASLAFERISEAVSFCTAHFMMVGVVILAALLFMHLVIAGSALEEWRQWRATWSRENNLRRREAALDLSRTYGMSGSDFESYVARLFRDSGFHVQPRGGPRDQGCDLLLSSDHERVVCQVKRSSRPVTNKAVQEAVAAIPFYNAHRAIVVTNATFTKGARDLALANRCELLDHQTLQQMVASFSAKITSSCQNIRHQWAERIAAKLVHNGQITIPVKIGENATQHAREMKWILNEYLRAKDARFANWVRVYVASSKWVGFMKRPIILLKASRRT